MTRLRRHRQVSNWRESCMIFAVARRYHADTDHPARHDLPLPAAGRLWRAPDDAPPTRLPRSKSDRGEPRDQPGAQEPALRSGRIRQSCGDRAVFWSLKRAVLREHRVPRAISRTTQGPFPSTIAPTRCRTSPIASNAITPIRGTWLAAGLVNSCPRAGRTHPHGCAGMSSSAGMAVFGVGSSSLAGRGIGPDILIDPRIRQAARSNDTRQRPLSLPEAVLICFRLQMQLLHKKSLICTKTLGSIGAMMSTSQRSGLEFRFERGVSLGLKSFIARLDEFRTGVAL